MSLLRKEIKMPRLRAPNVRVPKRGAPKPRAPKPDAPQPDAPRQDGPQPDALQFDAPKSGAAQRRAPRRRTPSRRPTGTTGLEIGATQAVAAEASLQDGRVVAERVAARPLPHGLVNDGAVVDADALAVELRELFADHQLGKRVRVGLATPRTILRVIDLPPLEEKDIRAALMMQAQERIPMPLERAVMDYQSVGLVDTADGQRLRVIVVVTEKEGVHRLLEALRGAGLKPEGIDLSIFAAIRALTGTVPGTGPVLYAQLGDLVNLAIANDGVCRFTRQAPQGLGMVLARLAEQRGISTGEAQVLLAELCRWDGAQLTGTPGAPGVPGAPGAPADNKDVEALLARTATELGSELRAAVEFYGAQFGQEVVTTGVITGPLAPLPGFVAALATASGLSLSCGEVRSINPAALGGVDPRIAPVACGLAVPEVRS